MATAGQWLEGARPRTLPNAIAPVAAGTGVAAALGEAVWWKALLALGVALGLIIGVNYANDYSDGVRGTDEDRVGPLRLVGAGLAAPSAVKRAAFVSLGIAAVAGVALALTTAWWLLLVGAVCIVAAWYYTGGRMPYGYSGFGEVAVFVFFGLVAVLGTQFVQAGRIDWAGVGCAVAVGSFSTGVMVTNNLRDIPTDAESGKRTLAVRLGDPRTRTLHLTLMVLPFAITVALVAVTPWAAAGLLAAPFAVRAHAPIRAGALGLDLVPALRDSGIAMLVWAVATAVGLAFG
ncbi:1,4-dihydroxy-2-naphthoate polyprenyltransferase [Rhodococcus chondri]|uniref:1,4-dihydroxy-2-naphthoate octaprenyltransferase n=1 Tax=Rhodococcus chondri TaxID=3065941 RepID=A0ABU7JYC4_9NOCA|nr:1,4-dihydroxy-2-naphthoate polyprenyltransferase [Rhodococcus sp. CC-R104]MEE2034807.1 1,4-dihydroxy-2-naphthoate polyprenyltransferase [Rhodococcus sp. CC-R104]